MRFLGTTVSKTDQKGRVFLPSVFRKELQASGEEMLVMHKDVHRQCLVLYPESVWNAQMDEMFQKTNLWDATEKEVLSMYMSDVELMALDGSGRILIPRRYIDMAKISQEVRFIGMNKTIEIWSVEVWAAEHEQKAALSQEEFAAKLKLIMGRTL